MKILLAQAAPYYPSLGGAPKSNRLLLEALSGRTHDCAAVTTWSENAFDASSQPYYAGAPCSVTGDCVRFRHKGVDVRMATHRSKLQAVFTQEVAAYDPAWILISSEDPGQGLLQTAVKHWAEKVIYVARTTMALPFGPGAAFHSERGVSLLRRAAGVVAITSYLASYFRRWAEIEAVPLSLSLLDPPPAAVRARFDRGFIMMINPCAVKGVSIFLELTRRMPWLPFAVVPTWGTTTAELNAIEERPNVRVLEPREDVDELFAECRVLLVPSLWAEAGGRCVVEAMARGIPVIASNVGGLPEMKLGIDYLLPVREIERYTTELNERLMPTPEVPPQDVEPWLEALYNLTTKAATYERVSVESRAAALQHMARATIDAFEQFLIDRSTTRMRHTPLCEQPL
jgi:glycosyltransferase involved in cell wall biosynthesis